jgi:hypothetical protein
MWQMARIVELYSMLGPAGVFALRKINMIHKFKPGRWRLEELLASETLVKRLYLPRPNERYGTHRFLHGCRGAN